MSLIRNGDRGGINVVYSFDTSVPNNNHSSAQATPQPKQPEVQPQPQESVELSTEDKIIRVINGMTKLNMKKVCEEAGLPYTPKTREQIKALWNLKSGIQVTLMTHNLPPVDQTEPKNKSKLDEMLPIVWCGKRRTKKDVGYDTWYDENLATMAVVRHISWKKFLEVLPDLKYIEYLVNIYQHRFGTIWIGPTGAVQTHFETSEAGPIWDIPIGWNEVSEIRQRTENKGFFVLPELKHELSSHLTGVMYAPELDRFPSIRCLKSDGTWIKYSIDTDKRLFGVEE